MRHRVVSREEWIEERRKLLAREKDFTRERDRLSAARRDLPWVRVDREYVFDGPQERESLAQLFAGRGQLIVYHFMFDPSWQAGCKSCSFWADNFDGIVVHLAHRDATMIAVSAAPLATLEAYRKRMGWRFKWVSSAGTDFNRDYHVSHTPERAGEGRGLLQLHAPKTLRVRGAGHQRLRARGRRGLPHLFLLCPRPRHAERRLSLHGPAAQGPR